MLLCYFCYFIESYFTTSLTLQKLLHRKLLQDTDSLLQSSLLNFFSTTNMSHQWICKDCHFKTAQPSTHVCQFVDDIHFNNGLNLIPVKRQKITSDKVPITSKLAIIASCMNQYLRSDNKALQEHNEELHGLNDEINTHLIEANIHQVQLEDENAALHTQLQFMDRELATTRDRAIRAFHTMKQRLNLIAAQADYVSRTHQSNIRIQYDRHNIPVQILYRQGQDLLPCPILPSVIDEETESE